MPQHKSAEKRVLTNEKRRKRNVAAKSDLRTRTKKLNAATTGEERATAVRDVHSALDKAAKRRMIHPRTASRRKSRLAKAANKASKAGA